MPSVLTALPPAAPLPPAAAYARLAEVAAALPGGLRIIAGPPGGGAGWVTGRRLADGGAALAEFLAWDDEQIRRDHGRPGRPDVVAAFGLHRYAWPVGLLFTVPWFLERRVPRLPLGNVAYHRGDAVLAVQPDGVFCLPEDPAAQLPGMHPVGGEEELRARLRAAVAEHLGPVLDAFRPLLRRGPHALWGMVVDEVTEGLWYVGHLLGEEDRAVAELGALLPGGTPPYRKGAGFRTLAGPGGTALRTRNRVACCLNYTLPSADACTTCPRTCDAERIGRLLPSS